MPQMTAIVINDGQSTPVAHTFSPKKIEDGIRGYLEEAVGVPVGRSSLILSVRPPVNNSGYYRCKIEITDPLAYTDPTSGVTSLRGTNRSVHEFLVHESSSDAEIKNIFAFAKNALTNATVKEAIETLTPLY